ncbi:MAG: hypothetical protein IJ231_10940, partial [Clostridia bacterium]|nr:hypothetical protein [Clostridia bacterium]
GLPFTWIPATKLPDAGKPFTWTRGYRSHRLDVNDVLYQLSHATLYVNRLLSLLVRVTFADAHRVG